MDFTPSQKLAIELRDCNILVSAAAGSGKTATLTERILQMVSDPTSPLDISRMLIVTFTRAAAGELRARISKKLGEALSLDPSNTVIASQLTSITNAKICTIDAYCLDLVRSNFQQLSLPANFRLGDDAEIKILKREIMNDIIERRYETDSSFAPFADEITTARNEGRLSDTLLALVEDMNNAGVYDIEPYVAAYREETELDFFKTRAGIALITSLEDELSFIIRRLDRMIATIADNPECSPYGEAISADCDFAQELLSSLAKQNYAASRQIAQSYSPKQLGSVKGANKSEVSANMKEDRDTIKKRLIAIKTKTFMTHEDSIPEICKKSADFCEKLCEILNDYYSALYEQKLSRAVCEFSDLRRFATRLLIDENGEPTQIARDEREKYDAIFVDEYQDTDSRQDAIFRTISRGNNLFFVGDIKQSIYSFRGAEPSLFASYRRAYAPATIPENLTKTSLSIFMSNNFRCSPNIIKFTNQVCGYLFREIEGKGGGIGYVAEDDLVFSRPDKVSENKVHIVMLEKPGGESEEAVEYIYLISEIQRLLSDGKKPDGERLKASDIAILTRSNSEATRVSDALAKAGIAHANSAGVDLFENPEVLLMLSLLSATDNPQRDIPLSAALKSPIFGFTLDDLVKIRFGRTYMSLYDSIVDYAEDGDSEETIAEKCKNAIFKLSAYQLQAQAMPVSKFIRLIWQDTNALTYAGSDASSKRRSPAERRRNLRKLYDYARVFEASEFRSLHDFIEYINGVIGEGTTISSVDGVTDETIQVMTVHKSKGLEFSVVFLVGCASLGKNPDPDQLIFCPFDNLGLALNPTDYSSLGVVASPFRLGVSKRLESCSADDEIRVLYVALTRAKDELYIVSSGSEGFADKRIDRAQALSSIGGRQSILDSRGWLNRILIALFSNPDKSAYQIELYSPEQLLSIGTEEEESAPPSKESVEEYVELFRPVLEYEYRYRAQSGIPAKLSVSRLYPEALNEENDSADLLKKAHSYAPRKPRFMGGEALATEKGTATHLFMQFCDFNNLGGSVSDVENELERLIQCKFIPDSVRSLVRCDEIARFSQSTLFSELLEAQQLHRELRFNIFLPASSFTTESELKLELEEQELMVQGVIDLCFTSKDGKLILCDYKTDRLTKAELENPHLAQQRLRAAHAEQLSYYSDAIERIMGRKPDRVCIYSLCLGDTVDITV